MKIYTSYFAKLKQIEKSGLVPVSISGKAPDWYKGLQYKILAPKYGFFMEWKQNHDNNFYIKHFKEEVTDKLSFSKTVMDLNLLSKGNDVVLLCYEKPSDFCHRHLIADWLKEYGVEVDELEV